MAPRPVRTSPGPVPKAVRGGDVVVLLQDAGYAALHELFGGVDQLIGRIVGERWIAGPLRPNMAPE